MNILSLLIFYCILWPFYFRVALFALKHYIVKQDVTDAALHEFLGKLRFPFSLFSSAAWQNHNLIDGGALKLVGNLDALKSQSNGFRSFCLIWSIPSICLIVACVYRSLAAANLTEALLYWVSFLLNSITLVICWRFGHRLKVS